MAIIRLNRRFSGAVKKYIATASVSSPDTKKRISVGGVKRIDEFFHRFQMWSVIPAAIAGVILSEP